MDIFNQFLESTKQAVIDAIKEALEQIRNEVLHEILHVKPEGVMSIKMNYPRGVVLFFMPKYEKSPRV